jgi:SAM-dependent methyltransferase
MRTKLLEYLCCPHCLETSKLTLKESHFQVEDEVAEGTLHCNLCERSWPITNSIPRFVSRENYAENFGLQWNRFKRTQLDKFSGLTISRDRFFKVTQWPDHLESELILDAGCGAGRFTEAALSTGVEVIAFDLSDAVDANLENNRQERLHVIQADIFHLPFRRVFDRVFCLGVLQHTPDPQQAFLSLPPLLKTGGGRCRLLHRGRGPKIESSRTIHAIIKEIYS